MTHQPYDRLSALQIEHEVQRLQQMMSDLETKLATVRSDFQAAMQEREKRLRPAPAPTVTDHAVLRYIERVHGIDINSVRQEMLSPTTIAAMKAGAASVTVRGIKFVVNGMKIVTVWKASAERRAS